MEDRALRQKRRNRRAENLSAMRLPLAPTAEKTAEKLWKQKLKKTKTKKKTTTVDSGSGQDDDDDDDDDANNNNAMAIATEIEMERTQRRIATRGVVALFNAISKHRAAITAVAVEKEEDRRRIREEGRLRGLAVSNEKKRNGSVVSGGLLLESATTKHGFLDMIKMSAAAAGGGDSGTLGKNSNNSTSSSVPVVGSSGNEIGSTSGVKSIGWTALKDDFMMNSKLKVS